MRDAWFPFTVVLIVGLWAYTRFNPESGSGPTMPAKVTDAEELELYLTPLGGYTAADIEANGRSTASEKYAQFQANHDADPQPGDRICPITRTKANPRCLWVVNGREYQFCCPPCIDEFVRLAKTDPTQVQSPDVYIQR